MLKQMPSAGKKNCKKNNKVPEALFKEKNNGKIWYNHLQLSKTHKTPVNLWAQRIQKTQSKDEDLKNYKNQKAMYIPKSIAKEFVKEFHANLTQRHNKATMLVKKLKKKYIVYGIHALT